MSPNDADGMANSVDPDQTAPLGAVWSGSALFAQAYLSENLGSLRYFQTVCLYFSMQWVSSKSYLLPSFIFTEINKLDSLSCEFNIPANKMDVHLANKMDVDVHNLNKNIRCILVFANSSKITKSQNKEHAKMIYSTIKILEVWTPEKIVVITLKFEQGGSTIE